MKKQFYAKITGKVQGVFFRAEAQEYALTLRLAGWVRNTADGGLELIAQGKEQAILKFLEWCKRGPERAMVEHVEINWQEPKELLVDFSIRY